MACMSKHHQELTDGVGKCSVPMWSGGCPAGFCDLPAYGKQAPVKRTWPTEFPPAFAPGLACPIHGGPPKKECDMKIAEKPSKSNANIIGEMDGMAAGLDGESCHLRSLAQSFINVGNSEVGKDLNRVADRLDLYQNDLRDYAGWIASNDARSAEQATRNMIGVALGAPDTKGT